MKRDGRGTLGYAEWVEGLREGWSGVEEDAVNPISRSRLSTQTPTNERPSNKAYHSNSR